ncbi:TetR/AcrR family transcriptional regulator [Companilactobacillus halodurans]|uniref:TetR/AcrR family transcriptional regulator n=1 Tax=Companilactobacillus halodurans TaxID=2584183 RepID=A0A5P0ZMB7_9LACO|nr:TetR/AcrR family transcriptional regulator [Companilactobacillus halodurans]MQS75322.1 TetR/AcrR family transcriptional regulator [Companilactobacillus halodurans]MQS97399.1 TetR/AcrR family transcriptional regulator [Companilactobacillus halodurans]
MNNRKTDRRTIYTINVIKESFLELIDKEPYSQINVAQLCRQASINRSTFYLHFDDLTDVLNTVLDDALLFTNESDESSKTDNESTVDTFKENESLIPACQRVAGSPKYQKLLMDPSLSDYIIGRIITHEKPTIIPEIQKRTGFSKSEAEALFSYSIHGSFAINKRHHFIKDESWYHELKLLNQFTSAGYDRFNGK